MWTDHAMIRPRRRLLGAWLGALALLAVAGGGEARAQPAGATPILVRATIDSESLVRAWGPEESRRIAESLSGAVAEALAAEFAHWAFGPGLGRFYATLELRVVENARHKVDITLEKLLASGERDTLWRAPWLKPADFALGRRPPSDRAAERLRATFTELFDESRRQRVRNWLENVPIGATGTWSGVQDLETLRIVTSLPWQRFATLERSRLKVSFRRQGNDIEVVARGTDQPQPFYHRQLDATYDALVLKPERVSGREIAPGDLDDLINSELRLIYLLEEREPVDDEFFSLG